MATTFTFVNVNLNEGNRKSLSRSRAIALEDRARIRSIAATNPWNKHQSATNSTNSAQKRRTRNPKCTSTLRASSHGSALCKGDSSRGPDTEIDELCIETVITPGARVRGAFDSSTLSQMREIQNRSERVFDNLPNHIRSSKIDPFWNFPVPFRPYMSRAMHHRVTFLSPPTPEIDVHIGTNSIRKYFAESIHQPANLFAEILFSATHLYYLEDIGRQRSSEYGLIRSEDLVWLKGCTLSFLNLALKESLTPRDIDCALSAVMSLAIFEKTFGEEDVYKVHLQATRRLIALRGGINALTELQRRLIYHMAEHQFDPGSLISSTISSGSSTPSDQSVSHITSIEDLTRFWGSAGKFCRSHARDLVEFRRAIVGLDPE